jgi:NADPH:quinone reductase
MPKAVRIHQNGGPEVMRFEEVALGPHGPGEVRLRHCAIGINFSDVNVRRGGFYFGRPPQFPLALGNEAAGVIEALGDGVTGFSLGERVAYAGMRGEFFEDTGAYCEARNVPAERLLQVPDGVSDQQAAAMLVKGFTAWLIINRLHTPQAGDTILIHGIAGGVGLALCEWSKHLGATVIGTVGSAQKAAFARRHGCDHAILYRETDFVGALRAIAPHGVAAVFDGVGKDTFIRSLDCVRRFGMLVNYGNASGHPPPLDLLLLARKGSLSVARPALSSVTADLPTMRRAAADLFDLAQRGVLTFPVSRTYPLCDAAQAHRDIEARKSAGSMVLLA